MRFASPSKKGYLITKATLESLPAEFRIKAEELMERGELKLIERDRGSIQVFDELDKDEGPSCPENWPRRKCR